MPKKLLISKDYYLEDLTYSPMAVSLGLNNTPNVKQTDNLKFLIRTIVQPIKDHYKKMIIINSGFRSGFLNAAVGGVPTSQHCNGEAVDLEIDGVPNKELAQWVLDNLPYDQLILEFYNPMEGVNSGWVHISTRKSGRNRKNLLVAYKNGKSTRYESVIDFTHVA